MESPFYKKILLKLSGEALMGDQEFGISSDVIASYAKQIKEIVDLGVEVSIVIGGEIYSEDFLELHKEWIELQVIIWECLPLL